jgi:hypothetical protein
MKDLGNNIEALRENSPSKELVKVIENYIENMRNTFGSNEDNFGENFELDLGGKIYLVETEVDLKQIQTVAYDNQNKRYFTIDEKETQFDIFEDLKDGYYQVSLITHNGGGNIYLIPKQFEEKYPLIKKSFEITKQHESQEINLNPSW